MEKNRFNISRCWSLLKNDLRNNSTDILLLLGAVFLIVVAVSVFSLISPTLTYSQMPGFTISRAEAAAIGAIGNCGLAIAVVIFVVYSRVFNNMSQRGGEIRFLQLPATNAEKWLSRVLYVLIVGFVLVTAAYYLGLLGCGLLGQVTGSEALRLIPRMGFDSNYILHLFNLHLPWQAAVINYASAIFLFASFVLGGTWFRRLPWLYTALILLALFFVFAITGGFGMGYYLQYHTELIEQVEAGDISAVLTAVIPFLYVCAAIALLLSVAMLWLSYRLFCRRQLEARKIRIIG